MRFCCLGTSAGTSKPRTTPVAFSSALPHASDYKANVNKLAKKQPCAAGYCSIFSSFCNRLTPICSYPLIQTPQSLTTNGQCAVKPMQLSMAAPRCHLCSHQFPCPCFGKTQKFSFQNGSESNSEKKGVIHVTSLVA